MKTTNKTPQTAINFDEWLKSSTVEVVERNVYLVLTDYDNAIEVDTESYYTANLHTVESPFEELTENQMESLFCKVEEFKDNSTPEMGGSYDSEWYEMTRLY